MGTGGMTGSDFKVIVQSISQPTIKDMSNNYFTIIQERPQERQHNPITTVTPFHLRNQYMEQMQTRPAILSGAGRDTPESFHRQIPG